MKICPHCFEEIKEQAKKCPHCCEWIRAGSQWKRVVITLIPISLILGASLYVSNAIKDDILARVNTHPSVKSLEVTFHHKMKTDDGSAYIIGQIKNKGSEYNSSLKIEASLYDKNNQLVDIASTALAGGFQPNEVRPFKIAPCCKNRPHAKSYDHYELKLRSEL
jgi:hypothetical protein